MSIEKLVESVTPEIYENMQKAIETGKWPNGVPLSEEQKANCLQVVIAYDAKHKDENDRVGFLPTKPEGSPSRNRIDSEARNIRIIED